MDIVVCTDKGFIMPTGVLLYSTCVNNPNTEITFHIIIDESVGDKEKRELEETVSIFRKNILFYLADSSLLSAFPSLDNRQDITVACYWRLMISEILPNSIPKVLYLDGDIIVRQSLMELWETDISDCAIAAAPDYCDGAIEFFNRLKYSPQLGYFNSGVMLINLAYWREHNVISLFNQVLNERSNDIVYHDQDVLNMLFCKCKCTLPIKYNLSSGFLWDPPRYYYFKYEQELIEARQDPVIVHFSSEKPWYRHLRDGLHPFRSTWYLYQNQTRWKGILLNNRNNIKLILRVRYSLVDLLRKWRVIPYRYRYIGIAPID